MAGSSLGENTEIMMGQSPPGETCNTSGVGLPLLNGPTEYGPYYPTPVQFTTDARKRAKPGDILFCVRGSTTGRMNWADREYAIGRGVAAIHHKTKPELQPLVRAVIEYGLPDLLAQATGSTFPNVSADQLSRLWWPPLEDAEQHGIAHILGTLDNKIELNRRMNETLEAVSRVIFRSWFVNFDPVRAKMEGRDPGIPKSLADLFPDRFVGSKLGEIPAGWSVASVDGEFDLTMGQSPPGNTYNETGDGLPFYQGRADFSFRFPTRRVYCTSPSRFAKAGDTLISVRAPVGDINMALEDCAIGRGVAAARHKTASRSYTYQFMRALRRVFAQFEAEGTVFGALGKRDFHAIPCFSPPRSIVMAYEECVSAFENRIEVNERESRTLATLRAQIMTKLISGEMSVPGAASEIGGRK
ncbi:MAG: restriction endonuclease subunit S [Candidatus Krumholzibacteriaceae bacterium]